MRILLQFLALYLGGLPVCAQTTGATELLTRGPGAEAAALGSTVVSTIHDPTALYWNPAGLAFSGGAITGEHLFLFDGGRYDFVGLSVPSGIGTFGLGALQLDRGGIIARNAIDDPGTTVSNTQTDFLIGLARRIGEHFAAGGTANILRFNLAGYQDMGFGADLGGQAFYPADDFGWVKQPFLSFGAVLKNLLPPSLKLLEEKEIFPRELRGGMNLSFNAFSRASLSTGIIKSDRSSLSISFRKVSGEPLLHLGLGASYTFDKLLVLRLGYDHGLSGGMGFRTEDGKFSLDYALENKPLSMNHRFTLTYRFLAPKSAPDAPAEEADEDYSKTLTRAQALSEEQYRRGQGLFKELKYGESLEPLRLAWLLDADSREKTDAYKRALEVARREKLRQLAEKLEAAVMPGNESKAFAIIAAMLDLKPTNQSELITILGKLRGRMAASDLDAASAKVVEERRPRIERLDSVGLISDAAALAANLEFCRSNATAGAIAQLKDRTAKDGQALRARLEGQAVNAGKLGAFGEAYRSLVQLQRAFPNDPEIAKEVEAARNQAVARVSLTLKERLYLRRLYFLAAIQYANHSVEAAKDLLGEIFRRNSVDQAATALEDATIRADTVEDQLQ